MRESMGARLGVAESELLAAIVASSDDAIISKGLDGVVASWNAAAERLFGYSEEEAVGRPLAELIIPDDRAHEEPEILARLSRGERIDHYETVRRAKDGRLLDVSITVSPVRNSAGQVIGASKIARDITAQRKLLESERLARSQAERLSALKDEFLSTLSHELRSPLSAIMGWTELLRRSSRTPQELTSGLEVIERNVRLQTRLVDELLDVSRISSGKVVLEVKPLVPATVIQAAVEAVRPAADAKGVRLYVLLDETAGPITGDPTRLQQIVWNLLSNAIKFTGKGGRVSVTLQRVNSHVELSVADTGIGIAPEFLPHVFERFRQADGSTTRRVGGLGLGLSIAKSLVELHGGAIRAKSSGLGQGATFTIELPLLPVLSPGKRSNVDSMPSDENRYEPHPLDLAGVRVLVVEDEPDGREVIVRVLRASGAEVYDVGSAEEAIEQVGRIMPTVIVSDIGMPDMDGYEMLRRIRALPAEAGGRVPAVALTAFARPEDRTRALRSGFIAHVAKPVQPSELVATVAAIIAR
jgi:PAS domain S-box-containing protein